MWRVLLLLLLSASAASAASAVAPDEGWSWAHFNQDVLGGVDRRLLRRLVEAGSGTLVLSDGNVTAAPCVPGEAFELVADGAAVAWGAAPQHHTLGALEWATLPPPELSEAVAWALDRAACHDFRRLHASTGPHSGELEWCAPYVVGAVRRGLAAWLAPPRAARACVRPAAAQGWCVRLLGTPGLQRYYTKWCRQWYNPSCVLAYALRHP